MLPQPVFYKTWMHSLITATIISSKSGMFYGQHEPTWYRIMIRDNMQILHIKTHHLRGPKSAIKMY